MNIEAPSLQHLSDLLPTTPHLDLGLLQPRVLDRVARHLTDVRVLTMMITDAAAIDGPPLPTVRRLRLVRAKGFAGLWPRLLRRFPAVDEIDFLRPVALSAPDLSVLAEHGITGLGIESAPDAQAADVLGRWPTLKTLRLGGGDHAPWLSATAGAGVVDLEVHAHGRPAVEAVRSLALPLTRLALHRAGDLKGAERLSSIPSLRTLALVGAPNLIGGLGALSQLQALTIDDCIAPPACLVDIAHMRDLHTLRLNRCHMLEGGVLGLLCGLPELKNLDVSDCHRLGPDDLRSIAAAGGLRALSLRGLPISTGLGHLHRLLGLRRLDLTRCPDLDATDFADLAVMRWLERLDLTLLAWKVEPEARAALIAALGPALSHYTYRAVDLPDGALQESVVFREAPWVSESRVTAPFSDD